MFKLFLIPINISNDLAKRNCAVLNPETFNRLNVSKS